MFELVIWTNSLLWKDELNPRVRCAFGNVFFKSPPQLLMLIVTKFRICKLKSNFKPNQGLKLLLTIMSWQFVFNISVSYLYSFFGSGTKIFCPTHGSNQKHPSNLVWWAKKSTAFYAVIHNGSLGSIFSHCIELHFSASS